MQANKQNRNVLNTMHNHHPSQESKAPQYRPSIKVGYKVTSVHPQPQKRAKRKIQPNYISSERNSGRRGTLDMKKMFLSGAFVGDEYIKGGDDPAVRKKGAVVECRVKFQSGEGVKQNLKTHVVDSYSRRSSSVASVNTSVSKNPLPSYQKTGIKDILQYHHAGQYRDAKLTEKCTSTTAISRFYKFEDLHQYDFRKRPEFLR